MGSSFGQIFKVTTWGESHGKGVGAVVEGCLPGMPLDVVDVQEDLNRRRPGRNQYVSSRQERDLVEIWSGVCDGVTTGSPISIFVRNEDAKAEGYYSDYKGLFRSGHADLSYFLKYGLPISQGQGRSSGRETVGRVIGGSIAHKLLVWKLNAKINAYLIQVGGIRIQTICLESLKTDPVFCPDKKVSGDIQSYLHGILLQGDSVGGIVEIQVENVPAGLGEPVFDKLEADLAKALMSIGGVIGVEIGIGFKSCEFMGSKMNDQYVNVHDNNSGNENVKQQWFKHETNHSGGISGGISTGNPIILRIAVKAASSIGLKQSALDWGAKEVCEVSSQGRYDPCIAIRIVPVAKAMVSIAICDHWLRHQVYMPLDSGKSNA